MASTASGLHAGSLDLPRCCACGQQDWRAQPPTRLHQCAGCGAIFNARSRSRAEEEAIYDHYTDEAPRGDDHVAATQWSWVKSLTPLPTGSVLDVGCGYGAFLAQAQAAGWRGAGVELDPKGAAAARERGLDVRHGSFFDVELPPGPFDLITMWDVLEHLEEPAAALKILVPHLAAGGLLVIRGRNAGVHAPIKVTYARMRGLFRAVRVPDLSCIHRWGFGKESYRRLLANAGLEDIRAYPGVPTPGDRSSVFRARAAAAVCKGVMRAGGASLYRGTGGRLYLFPSVLMVGRKGQR